jgi:hypothetical protein
MPEMLLICHKHVKNFLWFLEKFYLVNYIRLLDRYYSVEFNKNVASMDIIIMGRKLDVRI